MLVAHTRYAEDNSRVAGQNTMSEQLDEARNSGRARTRRRADKVPQLRFSFGMTHDSDGSAWSLCASSG